MMVLARSSLVLSFNHAVNPPTISSTLLTNMKLVLLTFVGACAAGAITNHLKAQDILGKTETRVTGGRPPVPDAAVPTVTQKLMHTNGVECE
jgi:hypothetical protein